MLAISRPEKGKNQDRASVGIRSFSTDSMSPFVPPSLTSSLMGKCCASCPYLCADLLLNILGEDCGTSDLRL